MLGGGALDDFFTQQLGTLPSRTNTLNWQALQLHRHESQEEIHQTIMQTPPEKALGPDGFIGLSSRRAGT
jgi:hypothetical protein